MRIIISPAKKMNIDIDDFPYEQLPQFLDKSETLLSILSKMDYDHLKKLWACNDKIAALNFERIKDANLKRRLTPAILSYEGIQYQYMAPHIFEAKHFEYIRTHLRILSGFYGILNPFDGVIPYRLEMQAKLKTDTFKNLYDFWGTHIASHLMNETDLIIDLASKEYSQAVIPYLNDSVTVITCHFVEESNGKLITKGTRCKMARGAMVRFMAEYNVQTIEGLKSFNDLNYRFSEKHSSDHQFYFLHQK